MLLEEGFIRVARRAVSGPSSPPVVGIRIITVIVSVFLDGRTVPGIVVIFIYVERISRGPVVGGVKLDLGIIIGEHTVSIVASHGSSTKSFKLVFGLALAVVRFRYESGSVVLVGSISRVGIAVDQGKGAGDNCHDQGDQGNDGIQDEIDDCRDRGNHRWLVEDIGVEHEEDGVDEVDDGDEDIEQIGPLVHEGSFPDQREHVEELDCENHAGTNLSVVLEHGNEQSTHK